MNRASEVHFLIGIEVRKKYFTSPDLTNIHMDRLFYCHYVLGLPFGVRLSNMFESMGEEVEA